jgi:hypothetical protein
MNSNERMKASPSQQGTLQKRDAKNDMRSKEYRGGLRSTPDRSPALSGRVIRC